MRIRHNEGKGMRLWAARLSGALLAVGSLAAPVTGRADAAREEPRLVFAHYMGCLPAWTDEALAVQTNAWQGLRQPKNFYDTAGGQFLNMWLVPQGTATNLEACARLEIARARRGGLDGFVFDAWAGGGSARKLLDVFFKVVEEDGLDFKLTICFDADCHRPNDTSKPMYRKFVETTRELLDRHGKSPALARRRGRPLLFTYHLQHVIGRGGPWRWDGGRRELVEQAWKDFRREVGEPVYLHGCIDGIYGIEEPGPFRYEVAAWAARNFEAVGGFLGVKGDWRLDPKIAEVVRANGAEWSQPVFPQFSNHGWWIYSEGGFDTFRNNWKAAIDTGSSLIQVVTWNDYGEETSIAPTYGSNYTTLRLNRYFADLWKTGKEPAVEQDEVHACYRRAVGTPDAFPFRARRIGKLPDVLEVFTFLTAPARVVVDGYGEYEAPAGYHYRQYPLKKGAVAVRVVRDGATACRLDAPEPVADRRWREDPSMQAIGSNYAQEWARDFPGVPPLRYSENGDADGDGLPNWFEMVYFGRWPLMATATCADPNADPDGDGATNLEEYRRGTDPTRKDTPYSAGFVWTTRRPTPMTERKPWAAPQPINGVFNPERDEKGASVWWWLADGGRGWRPADEGDFNSRDWSAAKERRYNKGFAFSADGTVTLKPAQGVRLGIAWESPVAGIVSATVTRADGQVFTRQNLAVEKGTRLVFPDDFDGAPRDGADCVLEAFEVTLMRVGVPETENRGQTSFVTNGCRVVWTDRTLEVGNRLFARRYVASGGVLRTVSFARADGATWAGRASERDAADALTVAAEPARWSPVGVAGVRVHVTAGGQVTRLDLYPDMPGVIATRPGITAFAPVHDADRAWDLASSARLTPAVAASDTISVDRRHVKATSFTCRDQTDIRDQLLDVDERLLMKYDRTFSLAASGLDVRDVLADEGLVFVRLAPMPASRPAPVDDFIVSGSDKGVSLLANGFPLVELAYAGGEAGRLRALVAFQRAIRPYRPGRDGLLLSNTWGAGNRDSRICQDFLLKEIAAGAKIGVDVIQIDDGWQRGRTQNSQKKVAAGQKKVWNGYWAADPDFWKEDLERFPDGLDFLVKEARAKGMRFGLWFGPDSSDDAANWERDAACLLDYHRRLGIDYFKMDSMKLLSPRALARNRQMFDRMLADSDGDMVFDLDCTAEVRPGFLGLLDIGPLFVENRYTRRPVYWPHHTLKNLWDLSHVIDPVRLRFEFNNPDTNHENYEWSPLGHGNYRPDALFATVMAASPLAWMELSDVSEKSVAALAPLVKTWKAERARWHGGVIHPVANRPDGVAWTGFVSEAADGTGGYALLFRELNAKADFALDLAPIFGAATLSDAAVIGGRGTARFDGTRLAVTVPERLDFVWVKFAAARP